MTNTADEAARVEATWANIKRVHNNAVTSAKERNRPFTMTLSDTREIMFHHAPDGLDDKNFELPPDLNRTGQAHRYHS